MNLDHLRTFVLVADVGGIARAVPQLNLTQPAASRQIMALENELGVALFDRVGRRVQLTSDGRDLLQRARRLLDDVESLAERARMLKGGSTGTIRIGAPTQVIEAVLAPFAAIFRRRHPGVEVQFVEATAERLRRHIDSGDVQIGVLPVGPDPFEGPLLYPVHVTLVVPRQHRLARRRTADVAELAGEPVLLLGHQFGLRSWFDSACDGAHVKPRLVAESASPHTLVSLARQGFGVAVAPVRSAGPSPQRARAAACSSGCVRGAVDVRGLEDRACASAVRASLRIRVGESRGAASARTRRRATGASDTGATPHGPASHAARRAIRAALTRENQRAIGEEQRASGLVRS